MDIRVAVANGANVTLEMANVNWVESYLTRNRFSALRTRLMGTYHRYEEPDIGLRKAVTNEIGLSLQHPLDTVKSLKERKNCITICWKGRCET